MLKIFPPHVFSTGWRRLGAAAQKLLSGNGTDVPGRRTVHEHVGDQVCPGSIRGLDYLKDPRLNKGMAFTLEERQILGIHGLVPPRFKTQEEQVTLCMENLRRYNDDLNKYIYLVSLQDRNERLFYRLLSEYVEETMPIVYTPTVGLACQKFGLIYRRARGLFVTVHDRGHVGDVFSNWPENDVRAIVVTDGERILGLGDLGAYGMGIPVGKLALVTALAGIKPHQCLPVTLDVGTNNKELLNDPLYIGLKNERVTGAEYDDFVDEFMRAAVDRYGQDVLIQFEDFGNHNAFRLLDRYRNKYCCFNDDIQGTAGVAVAGLLASMRITKSKISDNTFLFLGAGEASLGIANLIAVAMGKEGVSREEACKKVWMYDAIGLVTKCRKGLEGLKKDFAKDHAPTTDFEGTLNQLKPSVLIGAAAAGGYFKPSILQAMAKYNKRPIIFALSNPTSKAECTAQEAYDHTNGTAIFASGSPFPPVKYDGKTYCTGQGNNAYIFPGVALGVLGSGMHHVSEEVFYIAAQIVANSVSEDDLNNGRVYPPLDDIKTCSLKIATELCEYAYKNGIATTYPEPKDKEQFLRAQLYDYSYGSAIPARYGWPNYK